MFYLNSRSFVMQKKIIGWIIPLLVVGLMIAGVIAARTSSESNRAPSEEPQFTLQNLKGEEVSLSDYRGKLVLINFWATWCPPCIREIPDLVKLHKEYKEKDFEILGIVISSKEPQVRKMVEQFKIEYPVLWGTQEAVNEFGSIPAIPRTFLINQEGKIVEDVEGMGNYEMFEMLIKKHL